MVKGTRRFRYILFSVTYPEHGQRATFAEFIRTLQPRTEDFVSTNTKERGAWVVHFDGTTGILKCHYQEKDHAIDLLRSLKTIGATPVAITTIATSGTIQGLPVKKNPSSLRR